MGFAPRNFRGFCGTDICSAVQVELLFSNGTTRHPVPEKVNAMEPIVGMYGAVAVATLFVVYEKYQSWMVSRQRQLRERVAYMLWVMANAAD